MITFTPERQQTVVFLFVFITTLLAVLLTFGLIGFEAYVRWTINKEFMFLGGSELGVLIASAFALTLGTGYLYRSGK